MSGAASATRRLKAITNDYWRFKRSPSRAGEADNKKYTINIYPGTQHAFNNDTGAARYNKAAADLAWSRTLAFFAENLGAPPKAA